MMPRNAQPLVDAVKHQGGEARRFLGPAFAALDLGTNNCRMLVAAPSGEGFRVLDSFSRIVRLGEGLHRTGQLSPDAMERALAALRACAVRLERRPVRRLRAIATEACRRAANGGAFLARVKDETGLDIGVISTREEAELALESCAPLLAGWGRRALLFDIGGGSTELAWVRIDPNGRPQLIGYDSLPVGVVTLAERFGQAGFDPDGFEAMVDDVADPAGELRGSALHRARDPRRRRAVAGHQWHGDHAGGVALNLRALPPPAGRWHGAERGCGR